MKGYDFYSITYRLFKLPDLETSYESYGQCVTYQGGAFECPEKLIFDATYSFEKGKTVEVCGNTYRMLKESRLGKSFEFIGDFKEHRGFFKKSQEGFDRILSQALTKPKSSCC